MSILQGCSSTFGLGNPGSEKLQQKRIKILTYVGDQDTLALSLSYFNMDEILANHP